MARPMEQQGKKPNKFRSTCEKRGKQSRKKKSRKKVGETTEGCREKENQLSLSYIKEFFLKPIFNLLSRLLLPPSCSNREKDRENFSNFFFLVSFKMMMLQPFFIFLVRFHPRFSRSAICRPHRQPSQPTSLLLLVKSAFPANIGATRATPTATPQVVISDGGQNLH